MDRGPHPGRRIPNAAGGPAFNTTVGPVVPILLVFLVFAVYAQGRYGGFILDDYANIGTIGRAAQGIDGIIRYVFDDAYGSPGRWLSKLSFLIDSPSWPSDAFRFKQNNILLHILNGLLVIWAFLCLMRLLGHSEHMSQAVALILGTLWLLHPLNVSTALYVVQRMTELSALFVLAGVLFYLKGRGIVADSPRRGYVLMSGGLITATLLGFLSKENAALLPFLVLTMESILLKSLAAPRSFRYWKALFLRLPSLALLLWLGYKLPAYLQMGEYRSFNLWERLMTESRVLIDYLRLILIPTRWGTGVYHDDFQISRGLLDPSTTLMSIAALAGLFGVAFKLRKKLPVLFFGVAWFFVGHILESTVVPLELYFEHRNYIPMLGPLFALCYYLFTTQTRLSMLLRGGLVVFTCLAAVSTWQNVYVWTDARTNLETWEKEHPNSPRFLQYAANLYAKLGEYDASEKRLLRLIALKPEWAGPKLLLLVQSCRVGPSQSVDALVEELPGTTFDPSAAKTIKILYDNVKSGSCRSVTMPQIQQILDQLIANPAYQRVAPVMGNLLFLRARVNGHLGNALQQAQDLHESYRHRKLGYVAKAESESWAALGDYERALAAIKKAKENNYLHFHGLRYKFDSAQYDEWEQLLARAVRSRSN